MTDISMTEKYEQHLEPRVARLETGLETLTKNVNDLTIAMRDNNTEVGRKLDALSVSVTNAAAPRRTDWSVIIGALGLIMVIGAAVFVPLNNMTYDNKIATQKSMDVMTDHMKLTLHPVGQALVQRLEEQITTHAASNDRVMKEHTERDIQEFVNLDKKLQLEYTLMNAKIETQIAALDTKIQLEIKLQSEIAKSQESSHVAMQQQFNDKIYGRVVVLEETGRQKDAKDLDELRQWRSKANGLSTPAAVVPLIPAQLPVTPSLK